MVRPNFTQVLLKKDEDGTKIVSVEGASSEIEDVSAIQVVLVQGQRVARAGVGKVDPVWTAEVPVEDPDGGPDLELGAAVAFGTETRIENLTTITWIQPVTIEAG